MRRVSFDLINYVLVAGKALTITAYKFLLLYLNQLNNFFKTTEVFFLVVLA